jgi:hypothetical protein
MTNDKNSAVPDSAMLEALQKDADIPHLPTQETYQFRMAVSGQGPLAYQWSDKPHRLLYDACSIIESQAAMRQPTQSDALLEGDTQTILYLLGVRHGREDERAKIAAEASQPTQSEDNCVECNGKGYAEIIDGCERPCDVCYGECFLRQPTQSDDEAYDLGKRDGYEKAVQDIDMLTGGDGEYCYSTIEGERHCPNVDTMKARIARRLRQFTQSDALREALGSVIALLDTQAEPPKSVVSVQDYARWANARIGLGLVMIAPRLRAALQEQSK